MKCSISIIRYIISLLLPMICLIGGFDRRSDAVHSQIPEPRSSPTPSQSAGTAEELNKLIVMIKCQFADDESFGAGIIFGKGSNRLYIVTANHVVRRGADEAQKLRIQFKWMPGEWKTAELLDSTNRDLDLAVLAIDLSKEGVQTEALQWNQLGDPGLLKSGDSVYSIGYPNGKPWRSFETPDRIYKNYGSSIVFETAFVAPGNSGGALLNQKREIVGIIREFETSDGKAVSIQTVIETLKDWSYPVHLKPKGEVVSQTSVDTAKKPSGTNAIYNFRTKDISDSELAITVDYDYSGGDSPISRITLNAYVPLADDKLSRSFDYSRSSQPVKRGGGTVTMTIKGTTTVTTNTIRISMVNQSNRNVIVVQDFPYRKEWRSPVATSARSVVSPTLARSSFVLPDDGVSESLRALAGPCCRVVSIRSTEGEIAGRIYLWDASKAEGDPNYHLSHGYQLQLWAILNFSYDPRENIFVSKNYTAFATNPPLGTVESVEVGALRFVLTLLEARFTVRSGPLVYLNTVRIKVDVIPIASHPSSRP